MADRLRDFSKIFAPIGVAVGVATSAATAVLTVQGVQDVFGLSTDALLAIGIAVFAFSAAVVILKQEDRWRAYEAQFNEAIWALAKDGIPWHQTEYLRRVKDGDVATVRRFWEGGMLHAIDSKGKTTLHYACDGGSAALAEEFIEQGADPNAIDGDGNTPLMEAAGRGHVVVVQKLLEHRVNIDSVSHGKGHTALYLAAGQGHLPVVKVLLEAGADVDRATRTGTTPLMAAAFKGYRGVVDLLLAGGANPKATDRAGATLMDHARLSEAEPDQRPGLVLLFTEHGVEQAVPALRRIASGQTGPGSVHIKWAHHGT